MVGAVGRLNPGVLPTQLHKTNIKVKLTSGCLQIPPVTWESFSRKAFCYLRCFTLFVPWLYNGSWGTSKRSLTGYQCPFILKSKFQNILAGQDSPQLYYLCHSKLIWRILWHFRLQMVSRLLLHCNIKVGCEVSVVCQRYLPLCQRNLFYFFNLSEKSLSSWFILWQINMSSGLWSGKYYIPVGAEQ